jgi:hypothetical protein
MTDYIYEKDLFAMKFRILISPVHNKVISEISGGLGLNIQDLRKSLIETLDMSYLENIPARYKSWCEENPDHEKDLKSGLCSKLFTTYIPVIKKERMEEINKSVIRLEESGTSEQDAVKSGRNEVLVEILKWA